MAELETPTTGNTEEDWRIFEVICKDIGVSWLQSVALHYYYIRN